MTLLGWPHVLLPTKFPGFSGAHSVQGSWKPSLLQFTEPPLQDPPWSLLLEEAWEVALTVWAEKPLSMAHSAL